MLALFGVIKLAVLAQDQAVILGVGDDLRGPDHTAAGIIAAEDGHDHPVIGSNIFKGAEDAGRDVEDVAFLDDDLARGAPAAPEKPPPALQDEKHLGGAVGVQRVAAAGRLARGADVEAGGVNDVDMLIGGFRDAAADDGEIFLAVAARGVGVDEGGFARAQVAVPDDAGVHLLRGHRGHP